MLEISPPPCERLSYQRVGVGTEQQPPRRLRRLGGLDHGGGHLAGIASHVACVDGGPSQPLRHLRPLIGGQVLRLQGQPAAVETRRRHARLHQGGVDAERRDLRRVRLEEPLDPPLAQVVDRQTWIGHLPAHARDLQNASAPLLPEVRGDRTGQLHRPDDIGIDLLFDLFVAHLLGRAEDADPGVRDHHVNAAQFRERRVHDPAHRGRIGHIQLAHPQPVAVLCCQISQPARRPQRRRDRVPAPQQLLGQLTPETTRSPGDKPGHSHSLHNYHHSSFANNATLRPW